MGAVAIETALDVLIAALNNAAAIGQLISNAKAEGRTELTAAEWASVTTADDSAMAALSSAIVAAGGQA
jgi:hypothetical protein